MDAIAVCYRRINPTQKYYWIIEGDIRSCFDAIDHRKLMKLIRSRIADRKLTNIIYRFLKAGYQEDGVIRKPDMGVPQGGVLSPLTANIYLHQLDRWWSVKYDLDNRGKAARRRKHLGNFILVRYCDDFIILSNGTKKATEEMKEEVANFLRDELRLELSQEKTAITHATEGFDFLGFNIRKYKESRGVIIKPSKRNIQAIKDKIAEHLHRRKREYSVADMIRALNPVVRGWANYYRFVNSSDTFHSISFHLNCKFLKWYRGKYQMPMRKGTKAGLKWMDGSMPLRLCRFSDVKIRRYSWKRKPNPYIEMDVKRTAHTAFLEVNWYGNSKRDGDLQIQCFQRDNGVCQVCLRPKTNIEAHHIIPLSEGGEDMLDNLMTLCKDCHRRHSWREIQQLANSGNEEGRSCLKYTT